MTPKPSESYEPAAAQNTAVRRHVHTNSHYHVKSVLTAVTHGAKHDGTKGYVYAVIWSQRILVLKCCSDNQNNRNYILSFIYLYLKVQRIGALFWAHIKKFEVPVSFSNIDFLSLSMSLFCLPGRCSRLNRQYQIVLDEGLMTADRRQTN